MRKIVTTIVLGVFCVNAVAQIIPNNHIYPPAPSQTVRPIPSGYTGDFNLNIIRVWEPLRPYTSEADVISTSRTVAEVRQTAQYFDGLGRPIQTVAKQASPAGGVHTTPKDMVFPIVYDEFGREAFKYLPFVDTGAHGHFKINPFVSQQDFMQQVFNPANHAQGEQFFYNSSVFEASPLNRPLQTFAPGNSWGGSNRGVGMSYEFNVQNEVRIWTVTVTTGNLPTSAGYYNSNELLRNVTTDEHGKRVAEYIDKQGRTILKKVEIATSSATISSHTGWLCTYYVYDDFGRLRFVIPPKATEAVITGGTISNGIADELCFRYEYDHRGRMIVKKVPGAGEVHMVYDARDRMVMTQDANLTGSAWLVTQYDALNRPVKVYFWLNNVNRSTHQASASNSSAYPTLSGHYTLMTETYYDSDSWAGSVSGLSTTLLDYYTASSDYISSIHSSPVYADPVQKSNALKGMVTGSKVRILDGSGYLYTLMLYDKKGRVIQVQSTNLNEGIDVVTNQYDFSGKLLKSHLNHVGNVEGEDALQVLTRNQYDDGGRLTGIYKKIDSGEELQISDLAYDELGQLKKKELGRIKDQNGSYTSYPLETLDYTYNIRGWLTGINRGYANNAYTAEASVQANRWFGMQLSYDFGYEENSVARPQFNGNISGIRWKSTGSDKARAYGFAYDAANRLMKADFTQYATAGTTGWNVSEGIDFTMMMGDGQTPASAYDANGNILRMWQVGLKVGFSEVIDDLVYTYFDNSNKLDGVEDYVTVDNKLGDFTDLHHGPDDYLYDNNGNLVFDANKFITIAYNHLNLLEHISISDANEPKGEIVYVYDAAGNKLKKVVTEYARAANNYTYRVIETRYIGGFVYESSTVEVSGHAPDEKPLHLKFFFHEEGRFRRYFDTAMGAPVFHADYFIKDHLGNVRMVLTDEQKTDQYLCSMESGADNWEELLFNNRNNLVSKPECFDSDDENQKVQKLGQVEEDAVIVGAGKVLKVMAGDHVNPKVYAWFDSNEGGADPLITAPLVNILAQLFVGNVLNAPTKASEQFLTSTDVMPGIGDFLSNQLNYEWSESAYLSWILLDDEQFAFIDGGFVSLLQQIEGACENQKVLLQANNGEGINISRNGYLYIYVSNTNTTHPVYFDDLHIEHTRGPLLEETHYYPFGLPMNGISSKAASFGNPSNKLKYNGKEEQRQEFSDGSGLEWLDFHARNLDPQIGRWHNVDPHAYRYTDLSPYCAFANNPIFFTDPDGRDIIPTKTFLASAYGAVYKNLRKSNSTYNTILNRYATSKAYNFSLYYGDNKVLPGALATTYTSQQITTWSQAGKVVKKEMTGGKSDSYYGETPFTRTREIVEDGKTMLVTSERSEIGMAKTLIHEAIHAKIGLTNKTDDDDHNTFSTYRNTLLTALKEYNTDNKLGFTDGQLDMLSWEGIHKSAAFKTYLEGLAKTNGTTYDEEYSKWNTEISKIAWKETKKEEKK